MLHPDKINTFVQIYMCMKQITVGIDIGGTNTAIGFVDREGNCLFETSIPTKEYVEIEPYMKNLCTLIQNELQKHPDCQLM